MQNFGKNFSQIFLICFFSLSGAQKWRSETNFPYPLFIDKDRTFYKLLNLKRSIFVTWNKNSLAFYGEKMKNGQNLPVPYQKAETETEAEDDIHQMGGDLIIDSQGTIFFIHRSRTSTDRPEIQNLMTALQ